MECRHCHASNAEDDHRCRRCGRRLRMTPVYGTSGSAVPALKYEAGEAPAGPEGNSQSGVATEAAPARRRITYQPSLFSGRDLLPRVVAFEKIAPGAVEAPPRKQAPQRTRPRRVIPGQQSLDFPVAGSGRRVAEGVIYCNSPVALLAHRTMAAALDGSVILIALALFGVIFRLAGGQVILDSTTMLFVAGIAATLTLFYKSLWCLANGDTAGMRWSHLTLVDFNGQPPARKERFYRLGASILSVLAACLGLLWALADEETLTWHDHISKTFPTPY